MCSSCTSIGHESYVSEIFVMICKTTKRLQKNSKENIQVVHMDKPKDMV